MTTSLAIIDSKVSKQLLVQGNNKMVRQLEVAVANKSKVTLFQLDKPLMNSSLVSKIFTKREKGGCFGQAIKRWTIDRSKKKQKKKKLVEIKQIVKSKKKKAN